MCRGARQQRRSLIRSWCQRSVTTVSVCKTPNHRSQRMTVVQVHSRKNGYRFKNGSWKEGFLDSWVTVAHPLSEKITVSSAVMLRRAFWSGEQLKTSPHESILSGLMPEVLSSPRRTVVAVMRCVQGGNTRHFHSPADTKHQEQDNPTPTFQETGRTQQRAP
jgi:hypothetical protein